MFTFSRILRHPGIAPNASFQVTASVAPVSTAPADEDEHAFHAGMYAPLEREEEEQEQEQQAAVERSTSVEDTDQLVPSPDVFRASASVAQPAPLPRVSADSTDATVRSAVRTSQQSAPLDPALASSSAASSDGVDTSSVAHPIEETAAHRRSDTTDNCASPRDAQASTDSPRPTAVVEAAPRLQGVSVDDSDDEFVPSSRRRTSRTPEFWDQSASSATPAIKRLNGVDVVPLLRDESGDAATQPLLARGEKGKTRQRSSSPVSPVAARLVRASPREQSALSEDTSEDELPAPAAARVCASSEHKTSDDPSSPSSASSSSSSSSSSDDHSGSSDQEEGNLDCVERFHPYMHTAFPDDQGKVLRIAANGVNAERLSLQLTQMELRVFSQEVEQLKATLPGASAPETALELFSLCENLPSLLSRQVARPILLWLSDFYELFVERLHSRLQPWFQEILDKRPETVRSLLLYWNHDTENLMPPGWTRATLLKPGAISRRHAHSKTSEPSLILNVSSGSVQVNLHSPVDVRTSSVLLCPGEVLFYEPRNQRQILVDQASPREASELYEPWVLVLSMPSIITQTKTPFHQRHYDYEEAFGQAKRCRYD